MLRSRRGAAAAVVLVSALGVLSAEGRLQRVEGAPATELASAFPIKALGASDTVSAPLAPSVSEAPDGPSLSERSEPGVTGAPLAPSFRGRRNRYPGPIPTPADWRTPDGPVRIALQAGHWRADEAPDELSGLKDNGTRWGETAEWELNLEIARLAGGMLEELGYEVDILPAVVPPGYRAHLFVAIHADGSNDPGASGYRVASPRRDATGRATRAAELLERSYGEATGIRRLPDTTRRMRNYYAFNFRRYEHALHPMTIGVILETGFMTSARDRRVLFDAPERAARGIVAAVTALPETPAPLSALADAGHSLAGGTPAGTAAGVAAPSSE